MATLGEASTPASHKFNHRFGIDERELMRATKATFKFGTELEDWHVIGDSYMHPSGRFGQDINGVSFHHYWLKQRLSDNTTPFDAYSLAAVAAKRGRFKHPVDDGRSVYSTYSYAVHLDATLHVSFLRDTAEGLGVQQIEDEVVDVHLRGQDGSIDSVELKGGARIDGELFIDCSGARGLLIEGALKTGYEDWRGWLPCDAALTVKTESTDDPLPYTRATASRAGWLSRVPLQNRVSNCHVYSSAYVGEDAAADTLLSSLEGKMLTEPELRQFAPGKRLKLWHRNCVAIGASGGCLGPLESTDMLLLQAAITKLVEFFPDADFPAANTAAYNRELDTLYSEARDFAVLHFKATQRNDSNFWDYCREMSVPDELALRMQLFASRGVVPHRRGEPFDESSWIAVLLGQGIIPADYDPRADCMPEEEMQQHLSRMREHIGQAAVALPSHRQAISEYFESGTAA